MAQSNFMSVIIPVAKGEDKWTSLLQQLIQLSSVKEIILSAVEPEPKSLLDVPTNGKKVIWLVSEFGRAKQLNFGAETASQNNLWFLHADSIIFPGTDSRIKSALSSRQDAIYYFDLKFMTEDSRLMRINEIGAKFRSNILSLPFGDQGFIISKKIFYQLGRFNESTQYGEDHLLIWNAHKMGYPVRSLKSPLGTSARKYHANGWLRTTSNHLWLTAKQALPELLKLTHNRYFNGSK